MESPDENLDNYKMMAIYPIVSLLDFIAIIGTPRIPTFEHVSNKNEKHKYSILLSKYALKSRNNKLKVKILIIIPPHFTLKSGIYSSTNQINYPKGFKTIEPLILKEGSVLEKGWE